MPCTPIRWPNPDTRDEDEPRVEPFAKWPPAFLGIPFGFRLGGVTLERDLQLLRVQLAETNESVLGIVRKLLHPDAQLRRETPRSADACA